MSDRGSVRGLATGDVLLILAVVAVALALAYPSLQRSSIRREADAAVADVDTVRAAAERYRERTGAWPSARGAHALPPELASSLPSAAGRGQPRYRLGWALWEILEEPEATEPLQPPRTPGRLAVPDTVAPTPPVVGKLAGIMVRSGDARVLAELLLRYAAERSFVRDSTWTLILGEGHDDR